MTTAAEEPAATLYDQIPYVSHPYPRGHVDRLATIGAVMGMDPAPIDACRALEIGCAAGGHLIPMAATLPGSQFVGIDLSARELADGQAIVAELGLKNIQLLHKGVEEVDASLGRFDYIICHGVFSWVPAEVRQRILEVCRACLTPRGIAYISFNTYPGWHFRNVVRDMMRHRARQADALERARAGRRFVESVLKALPATGSAYGAALKQEADIVSRVADWYLCHDHMADVNEPFYFHQFAAMAAEKELQYLGEADLRAMLPRGLDAGAFAALRGEADDIIAEQQCLDFVRGTPFRHSLLCRAGVKLNRRPGPECMEKLHVLAHAKAQPAAADPLADSQVTFSGPGGTLTTNRPLMKAAMLHLMERWPLSVPFDELCAAASARVAPALRTADEARADRETLGMVLLKGYWASDLIQLHAAPVRFRTTPGDRPIATPLARLQAARQGHVTNLRHDAVTLSELQRLVLQHLDGDHSRADLMDLLRGLARDGRLVLKSDPPLDPARTTAVLEQALETTLNDLARQALLVG